MNQIWKSFSETINWAWRGFCFTMGALLAIAFMGLFAPVKANDISPGYYCAPPMGFSNWFVGDPQKPDKGDDRSWNGATGAGNGIWQNDFAFEGAQTECRTGNNFGASVTQTGNGEQTAPDEDDDEED